MSALMLEGDAAGHPRRRRFVQDLVTWWGPETAKEWTSAVLASIVVGFAQIPASVAFAALANVPPDVGLHAAWIVGFINALFGGRPGMINGSAGALASVTCNYVAAGSHNGIEELFVSVSLAGVIIAIGAAFNIGRFVTLVPATVMVGFCNGLAIVIGSAQLGWFQEPSGAWVEGNVLVCTIVHCAISVLLMMVLPKLSKEVPASLLAIVAGFGLEFFMRNVFETKTVTVGELSEFERTRAIPRLFFLDSAYDLQNISQIRDIISQSLTLALVALLESLMTLEVVNDLTGTVGQPNRQVWALGLGNIVAGLFGTMGGNALIELSVMNVQNGGVTRASSTFVAFWVLGIVLFASPVLNLIPAGTLCGIIVVAVLETAKWSSIPSVLAAFLPQAVFEGLDEEADEASRRGSIVYRLRALRIERYDAFIIILVTVITAIDNLATAVVSGMFFASLGFAWQAQKPLNISVRESAGKTTKTYVLKGNLFFASKEKLVSSFTPDQDPPTVQIDFGQAQVYDFSAFHALQPILLRYQEKGTRIQILNMRQATHLQNLLFLDNVSADVGNASGLSLVGSFRGSTLVRQLSEQTNASRRSGV